MNILKAPRAVVLGLFATGLLAAVSVTPARAQGAPPPPPGISPTPINQSPIAAAARQVQDAQAQVVAAQQQYQRCRSRVEAQFKTREDWVKSLQAVDKAKADVEAGKIFAMKALAARPDYKAAKTAWETSDKKVKALQEKNGDPDQIAALSQLTLEQAVAVKKMEAEALAGEPKYSEAKVRLTEAQKHMTELQAEVDFAAQSDPDCQAATQALTGAYEQKKQADQNLAQIRKSDADARTAERKAKAEAAKNRPK